EASLIQKASSVTPDCLWSRPVMWLWAANLERAQIGSLTGEILIDVGQWQPAVHRHCIRLQPEVEVFGFIELLNFQTVLRVELRDGHEDVVVDEDAVLILVGGAAVVRKRREL